MGNQISQDGLNNTTSHKKQDLSTLSQELSSKLQPLVYSLVQDESCKFIALLSPSNKFSQTGVSSDNKLKPPSKPALLLVSDSLESLDTHIEL